MRSRGLLHKTRLQVFENYCETEGWVKEPVKGKWEVLRMRKDEKLMLVHTKLNAAEYVTISEDSMELWNSFVRSKS